MKKIETSESSQIHEPIDFKNIKEDNSPLNAKSLKFMKIKKPQNNKFIDRNALKNKRNSILDSNNLNLSEQEIPIIKTLINNQESSDNETLNEYTNLNEKVISAVSQD